MIKLNQAFVRDYTREAQRLQPTGEYVAKFAAQGKQMHYIAASHTRTEKDANGNVTASFKNPTFSLIDKQIAEYKPDFIIFESPDQYHSGNLPPFFSKINHLGYVETLHNESEYGMYQAVKHGIKFQGAEPNDMTLAERMEKLGYSRSDLAYYYAFRHIPEVTGDGQKPVSEDVLRERINQYLKKWSPKLGLADSEIGNYETFKEWFAQRNNNPNLTLLNITTRDNEPVRDGSATYLQKMSANMGDIRETSINQKIEDALNKHDRVMVVYGGGHLTQSLPVYEAAMGKAKYELNKPLSSLSTSLQSITQKAQTFATAGNLITVLGCAMAAAGILFPPLMGLPLALSAVASLAGGTYLRNQEKAEAAGDLRPSTVRAESRTTPINRVPAPQRQQQMASGINYRNDFAERYRLEKPGQGVIKNR